MKEFITANGKKRVIINTATFREVTNLKRAILSEIQKNPLGLKLTGESSNILDKEISLDEILNFIKNTVIGLELSESLENCIFECLERCTYDTTEQINKALFDKKPEIWQDYYEIVFECVKENISPFIKSLVSLWSTILPNVANSQVFNALAQKKGE